MPYLLCSLDRSTAVTSMSICKLSRRNNILLSVEDEWPTFLLRYSHLILPLSPLTVALTDYTWQRLDERRWWLGACLLWSNRYSWVHSSTKIIFKNPLRPAKNLHKNKVLDTRNSIRLRMVVKLNCSMITTSKVSGWYSAQADMPFPLFVPLCSQMDRM